MWYLSVPPVQQKCLPTCNYIVGDKEYGTVFNLQGELVLKFWALSGQFSLLSRFATKQLAFKVVNLVLFSVESFTNQVVEHFGFERQFEFLKESSTTSFDCDTAEWISWIGLARNLEVLRHSQTWFVSTIGDQVTLPNTKVAHIPWEREHACYGWGEFGSQHEIHFDQPTQYLDVRLYVHVPELSAISVP